VKLPTEGLTWREIDGETVLLDLHQSVYLRTNRTGTFLLRELVEGRDREDLVARLAEHYDLPEDTALADVETFVRNLQDRGLLVS
jgi:hypothetical protein